MDLENLSQASSEQLLSDYFDSEQETSDSESVQDCDISQSGSDSSTITGSEDFCDSEVESERCTSFDHSDSEEESERCTSFDHSDSEEENETNGTGASDIGEQETESYEDIFQRESKAKNKKPDSGNQLVGLRILLTSSNSGLRCIGTIFKVFSTERAIILTDVEVILTILQSATYFHSKLECYIMKQ